MLGLLTILAAAASTPGAGAEAFDRVTPQEAANRVTKCGLGSVAISHDDLLEEDLLTATNPPQLNDDQLACADKAASFYDLKLPDDTQKRYDSIREARLTTHFKVEARQWLSDHGLLDRLPDYHAGITDAGKFTRQVEELCGPAANGAFQSEYGPHTLSPAWADLNFRRGPKASETLGCLLYATRAAGYDIGLIGNEKPSEPK